MAATGAGFSSSGEVSKKNGKIFSPAKYKGYSRTLDAD
jgi:hypothetical protein